MVVVDEAFKGAGKTAGVEVFRIKDFNVLLVDKSQYGNFYEGDSYIILATRADDNGKLHHNVHFWCGETTSQDEMGTAAIKTVELDDLLGGGPVQYREVQDHESSLFLSYFKNGIKYLKGGFESGFRHVDDPLENFEPRLFQCKGKRNVRVKQVTLARDSLNRGDVFILDAGADVFVWMPPESGRLERIKGVRQAASIRDQERGGRPKVHVLDADWDTNDEFWRLLGGKGAVKSAEAGGADEEHMRKEKPMLSLWSDWDANESFWSLLGGFGDIAAAESDTAYADQYARTEKPELALLKVSDASGRMTVQKIGSGDNLSVDMLDSKDAFILDAASGGIFVWVGKGCTADERKKCMVWAARYLDQQNRPKWSQVVRVLESAEPAIFSQWFAKPPANRTRFEPHLFQCSDESGKLLVEEICNFSQEDLDGDDVMILDVGATVFVWIGANASEREKAASASIAEHYLATDALHRPATAATVSVKQGEEPAEFASVFKGWDGAMFKEQRSVEGAKMQFST